MDAAETQEQGQAVAVLYDEDVEQRQARLHAEGTRRVRETVTGAVTWSGLAASCSFAALQIAEQVAVVGRLKSVADQQVRSITETGLEGTETTSVDLGDLEVQRLITFPEGPEVSQTEAEWLRATAALSAAWLGGPREALRRIRASEVRRCEAAGHGHKLRRAQQAVEAYWRHKPAPQTVERWLVEGGPADERLLTWTRRLLAACRALQSFGQAVAPVPVRLARPAAPKPSPEQLDAMLARVVGGSDVPAREQPSSPEGE